MSDRYIEVIGDSELVETASRFVAHVTLSVRAAKDETALQDAAALHAEAVAVLRESQIAEDEMEEGGTNFLIPWWQKKRAGQNAERSIVLKVRDSGKLNRALENLDPLQSSNRERRSIAIYMGNPEYTRASELRAQVLSQAFEKAKAKAERLADTMGCRIGSVLQVEEGGWALRGAGVWGVGMAMAAGPAADPDLPRPSTSVTVSCRVRFEILEERR